MTTSGNSHSNKVYSNASLDELHKIFRHDTWFIIRNVYERLKGIDWVKFLACDVVKKVHAYGNVTQNLNQFNFDENMKYSSIKHHFKFRLQTILRKFVSFLHRALQQVPQREMPT